MNGTFRIDGGVPLFGEVTPIPNKNALMGALPAAALASGGITFAALPDTLDVHTYLEILTRLGATVTSAGDGATHIDPAGHPGAGDRSGRGAPAARRVRAYRTVAGRAWAAWRCRCPAAASWATAP